jgi:hypothetical protein
MSNFNKPKNGNNSRIINSQSPNKLDENSTFISEAPTPRVNPQKCDPYRKNEKVSASLDR